MKFPNELRRKRLEAGKTMDDLARVLTQHGLKNSTKQKIYKIEKGLQEMSAQEAVAFAEYLKCPLDSIITVKTADLQYTYNKNHSLLDDSTRVQVEKIPVWGIFDAQGEEKYAVNTQDAPIDWIQPLHTMSSGKGAFCLLISGETMQPVVKPGHIAYVDGKKPPVKDELCVVTLRGGGAYIKNYVRKTERELTLEQLNPRKEITLKTTDIERVLFVEAVRFR